ncbi:MAG: O-antigen ligase family protein [bacterium]
MLTFLVLVFALLVLGLFGAGILPGVLQFIAAVLCLGCILVQGGAFRRLDWLAFFAMALVTMVVLTAVPLPRMLEHVIGKTAVLQHELVRKAAVEADQLGLIEPGEKHFSLSRNRAGTLRVVLLLLAGFAAAAITARFSSQWKHRYLVFLALFGTVMAVAGYYSRHVFPEGKSLWWLFDVPHGTPIGCFINPNHFGGFIAMLCPVAVILFIGGVSRRSYLEALLWALCSGVMTVAVTMSLSFGASIACLAAMGVLISLLLFRRKFKEGFSIVAVVVPAVVAVVICFGPALDKKFRQITDCAPESSVNFRPATWRDSLRILPDYPLLGTGAYGLRMILPQYRSTTSRREADFAENEYVQVPVEFGLCGLTLIIAMCACVAIKWRKNSAAGVISSTVGLAVGGAIAVVMAHSAVDFSIRVPLYFVVFCSLVGLVISPGVIAGGSPSVVASSWLDRLMARVAVPAVGVLIVGIISLFGRMPHDLDSDGYLADAGPQGLVRALEWSPTSWRAWYSLGNVAVGLIGPDEVKFGERCIARAAEYDPKNYLLWKRLAEVRLGMNNKTGASEAYKRAKDLRKWVSVPELD